MNQQLKKFAISGLQWTLSLAVLLESVHFMLSPSAAREVAKIGLPQWIRPALGGTEVIAALLFLVPAAILVGGYLLLIIFAIAAVIHFLHGELVGVGSLIVYGMAVIVSMTHRNEKAVEASRDR
jgi:hypothetical protein